MRNDPPRPAAVAPAASAPTEVPLTTAALRLGKSYTQVLRLVLTGALRGRQVAGRWHVDAASLDAYAAAPGTPAAA